MSLVVANIRPSRLILPDIKSNFSDVVQYSSDALLLDVAVSISRQVKLES